MIVSDKSLKRVDEINQKFPNIFEELSHEESTAEVRAYQASLETLSPEDRQALVKQNQETLDKLLAKQFNLADYQKKPN